MISTFSGTGSVLTKCKLPMVSIIGVLALKTHSVISYADICPWTMWVTQSSSWRETALPSAEHCFVLLLVCWFVFWHSYQRCYFIYFHPQLFPKHTHTINIHENDQKSMLWKGSCNVGVVAQLSEWWLNGQSPCSVSMSVSDPTHARTKQNSSKMFCKFIAPDTGRSPELAGQPALPTSELWGQWETWSQTKQSNSNYKEKTKSGEIENTWH